MTHNLHKDSSAVEYRVSAFYILYEVTQNLYKDSSAFEYKVSKTFLAEINTENYVGLLLSGMKSRVQDQYSVSQACYIV